MHTSNMHDLFVQKLLDQADKLIVVVYKKITKGKYLWERSPIDDACEAMDKLYIAYIHNHEQQYGECDINLNKTIVNKMQNLQHVFDICSKTTSNIDARTLKIKKATLLVETAKATLEEYDRHIYDDMPVLRPIVPPPYTII